MHDERTATMQISRVLRQWEQDNPKYDECMSTSGTPPIYRISKAEKVKIARVMCKNVDNFAADAKIRIKQMSDEVIPKNNTS